MSIASHLSTSKKVKGAARYADILMNKRPVLINLEVIKSCNATCHFCVCWKMDAGPRLRDYSPVIKKIKPMVVSINGGEPLLRKDINDVVRQVSDHAIYTTIITNAGLLTADKAIALQDHGLDQLTISRDYLDERHDKVRGIPELGKRIEGLIPEIQKRGLDNIVINTIIMESNLDQVVDLAKWAHNAGIKISFSAYSSNKADNDSEVIRDEARRDKLKAVIDELKELK